MSRGTTANGSRDPHPTHRVRLPAGRRRTLGSMLLVLGLVAVLTLAWPEGTRASDVTAPHLRAVSPAHLATATASGAILRATAALAHGEGPAGGQSWSCSSGGTSSRCTPHAAARLPAVGGPAGWRPVSTEPAGFQNSLLTFDLADNMVVLLDGPNPYSATSNDVSSSWSYAAGRWSPILSNLQPTDCPGSALAYDALDRVVVFFGAANVAGTQPACPSANQTWTFASGQWNQVSPVPRPSPRYLPMMAYDNADGYLLLFGGYYAAGSRFTYLNDTWSFSGGVWNNLSANLTTAPPARYGGAITFDSADANVVLFGGILTSGQPDNSTWTFGSGHWTPLAVPGPPVSNHPRAGLVDDPADGVVLLVTNSTGAQLRTWSFHAGVWKTISPTISPPSSFGPAFGYDLADHYALLLGSIAQPPGGQAPTWSFTAGAWTNRTTAVPSARADARMTYDAADGEVVLFGGYRLAGSPAVVWTPLNDTWTFRGGVWTELTGRPGPAARDGAGMAYDAADGYVVLFGGYGAAGRALGDTWEFVSGNWSRLTPLVAPSNRSGTDLLYDGAAGDILLFGGFPYYAEGSSSPGGYNDTWTFHAGTWTNLTSHLRTAPHSAMPGQITYDATDGYVLLFGTVPSSSGGWPSPSRETWKFQSANWTNLTSRVVGAPPARAAGVLTYYAPGPYVVLWGGRSPSVGQWLADTWTYANGSWTEQFPSTGPFNRSEAASAVDTADASALVFGGAFGQGYSLYNGEPPQCREVCGDAWAWSAGGGNRPYIASFRALPAATDVGQSLQLAASAGGGVGSLTFVYAGLPPGCLSANLSTLACTPTSAGTYPVTVRVTDVHGNYAQALATVQVNPVPTIGSFTVSANPDLVGNRTLLAAQVMGGTPPIAYSYSGLPPGCPSQNVVVLPCYPNVTGNYTITVTVTDAPGSAATASAGLVVVPRGALGGPEIFAFAAAPNALVLGNTTNFGATARGGSGPLAYAYQGLPAGCATANRSSLPCTATTAGSPTVEVVVTDTAGRTAVAFANVTIYPVGGGGGALISSFTAAPAVLAIGESTVLLVVATGGVGPLGYAYQGLPAGCLSANASALPCTPTATGAFNVYVVTFDLAGHRAGVHTALNVVPSRIGAGPSISAFLADPSTVVVGHPVTFVVATAGGVAPLRYLYAGLPAGCSSVNAPALTCSPSVVGTFTVHLNVTDALGRPTSAMASVVVEAGPPGNPTPPGGTGSLLGLAGGVLPGAVAGAVFAAVVIGAYWRRRRLRWEGAEIVRGLRNNEGAAEPDDRT
ncbi:MAG: kelch motif-containing protein [Thermoplasmata archaeon]|nr:kelch motif-containing protein [Thermoplasmata archaeon]